MKLGDWMQLAERRLSEADVSSARLDAELLAAHELKKSRASILSSPDLVLSKVQADQLNSLLKRRCRRVPLSQLTGRREFFSLEFEITPDVLTPRVETETMVELAIRLAPQGSKLIDIGTGSGALAISIKNKRLDLNVTATDVSTEALKVAKRNAKHHQVQIEFMHSDLWESVKGRFGTIVTNLPYLTDAAELTPEVQHEPTIALRGGPDGLDLYRRFLLGIPDHLEPGGHLFTECDPWQQADLIAAATRVGLKPISEDYFILGFSRSTD